LILSFSNHELILDIHITEVIYTFFANHFI